MLNNKIAFITGSNGGIGKAIIEDLISNKAKVICAVRKADKNFLKFVKKNKKNIIKVVEFDLLEQDKMKNEINKLRNTINGIDILINCAGTSKGSLFELTKKIKKVFR